MSNQSFLLFGKSMNPTRQMEEFLNLVSEANVLFRRGIHSFLDHGQASSEFQMVLRHMREHEKEGETLLRLAETPLFAQIHCGERCGTMLHLMVLLGGLLHRLVRNLTFFDIENPAFPQSMHASLKTLTEPVSMTVESTLSSARAFLWGSNTTEEFFPRIAYFEKEADKLEEHLLRAIFTSDIDLAHKTHLRLFVERMDEPADKAQDLASWLTVCRSLDGHTGLAQTCGPISGNEPDMSQ